MFKHRTSNQEVSYFSNLKKKVLLLQERFMNVINNCVLQSQLSGHAISPGEFNNAVQLHVKRFHTAHVQP